MSTPLTSTSGGMDGERKILSRKLALICGAGGFPTAVINSLVARGEKPVIIGIHGITKLGQATNGETLTPDVTIYLGQLGTLFAALHARHVDDVAMIGGLSRPTLADLRFDFGALKRLPAIIRLLRGGDNHVLTSLAKLFEQEGFLLVAAHSLAPELLAPYGLITNKALSQSIMEDITKAQHILDALSPFDIGQGVVLVRGRVLAIEAADGTDGMLARITELRAAGRLRYPAGEAVLVKAPKRGQDERLDLPALGANTLEAAHRAGLGAIAYPAGRVLMLEPAKLIALANAYGLVLFGFPPPEQTENGAL